MIVELKYWILTIKVSKVMSNIIRTCIGCRTKLAQNTLYRFICKDKNIFSYKGEGRSFYICKSCVLDEKNISKSAKRLCKNNKDYVDDIKKILKQKGA